MFPRDNLSCEEFIHMIICNVDKFLHVTYFSPWVPPVVHVTNLRYAHTGFWFILCQLVPFAQVVLLTAMEYLREEEHEKDEEKE